MIKDFLERLQELQMDAFVRGLNMRISTRDVDNKKRRWIAVEVQKEGDFDDYVSLCLTEMDEREKMQENIKKIEDYIKTNGNEIQGPTD